MIVDGFLFDERLALLHPGGEGVETDGVAAAAHASVGRRRHRISAYHAVAWKAKQNDKSMINQ